MTREELIKQAQGENKTSVKLDVTLRMRTKQAEDGTPAFTYRRLKDDGTYEDVWMNKPIIGYLLGEAMCVEAFEDSIGKNGGTIRSTPYFSKDRVALYAPTEKKPIFTGTLEQAEQWASTQLSSKKLNKRRLFYIATKGGIIELTTNLSLSIDMTKGVNDSKADCLLSFTPTMYDTADKTISKTTHDILGKFAKKNKPCYAKIAVHKKLEEQDWSDLNLEAGLSNFVEWKKYKTGSKENAAPFTPESPSQPQRFTGASPEAPTKAPADGFFAKAEQSQPTVEKKGMFEDDLPF